MENEVLSLGTYFDMSKSEFISIFKKNKELLVLSSPDSFNNIYEYSKFLGYNINIIENNIFIDSTDFILHLNNLLNEEELEKIREKLEVLI